MTVAGQREEERVGSAHGRLEQVAKAPLGGQQPVACTEHPSALAICPWQPGASLPLHPLTFQPSSVEIT